jgi:hypothetical protein
MRRNTLSENAASMVRKVGPARLSTTFSRRIILQLVLKHASASRSSGEWGDDDYDVLADGVVVGVGSNKGVLFCVILPSEG